MQQGNNFIKKENKGFNVWVGNDYIGTLVIQEKRKSDDMVAKLTDVTNMEKLLKVATLKPFEPNKVDDTSDILAALTEDAAPEQDQQSAEG